MIGTWIKGRLDIVNVASKAAPEGSVAAKGRGTKGVVDFIFIKAWQKQHIQKKSGLKRQSVGTRLKIPISGLF